MILKSPKGLNFSACFQFVFRMLNYFSNCVLGHPWVFAMVVSPNCFYSMFPTSFQTIYTKNSLKQFAPHCLYMKTIWNKVILPSHHCFSRLPRVCSGHHSFFYDMFIKLCFCNCFFNVKATWLHEATIWNNFAQIVYTRKHVETICDNVSLMQKHMEKQLNKLKARKISLRP